MPLSDDNLKRLLAYLNRVDITPGDIDRYFERPGRDIGKNLGAALIENRPPQGYTSERELLKVRGIGQKRLKIMLETMATIEPEDPIGPGNAPIGPGVTLRTLRARIAGFASESPTVKAAIPAVFSRLDDRWETMDGPDWQIQGDPGPGSTVTGPGKTSYKVSQAVPVTESRSRRDVESDGLYAMGSIATDIHLSIQPGRDAVDQGTRLGTGQYSDAVTGAGGLPVSMQFELFTGPRILDIRETRTATFMVLEGDSATARKQVIHYSPWEVSGKSSSVGYLLRQIVPDAAGPYIRAAQDFLFDSLEQLRSWLSNPGIVMYVEELNDKNSSTTKDDLEKNFQKTRGQAPAIPDLSGVPVKPNCKKWTSKEIEVNDYGHSQTDSNEVRKGIPGMVNVSSLNDLIEKLKASVNPDNCECICKITFYGHGGPGAQSVGAGNSYDADREMRKSNNAVFAEHIKPLLCDNAVIIFYGCNVAEGTAGSEFLQDLANKTGATCIGYTGTVSSQWSYDCNGKAENYKVVPSGSKVTKTPQ